MQTRLAQPPLRAQQFPSKGACHAPEGPSAQTAPPGLPNQLFLVFQSREPTTMFKVEIIHGK